MKQWIAERASEQTTWGGLCLLVAHALGRDWAAFVHALPDTLALIGSGWLVVVKEHRG